MRRRLQEQDFYDDSVSIGCTDFIGTTALSGMVITKIDTPRPDRQDYLDLLIEKDPPNK
jgi:hypothetical protein